MSNDQKATIELLHRTVKDCRATITELEGKVKKLETELTLLDENGFQHAQPYMICVSTEIWHKVFLD